MGDIKKAISEVLGKSPAGQLKNSGMWDVEKKEMKPVTSYKLMFDSQQAQLEPIYYWVLDFINDLGWDTKKVTDNFMSSPGSGHFGEMSQRATRLQEEGMKILGGLNQVVKSVLNLIYDLKEFEIRLEHYDDAKSEDEKIKEQGMLALKQIWLDNVDIKKGRGAIHQMATMEMGYTTIRDAFMMANSVDDLKKMNDDEEGGIINDQVMRILIPRISEFLKWVDYSERELRKRMKIEKSYLRSQVETIKLYSQWMKPYLKAAEQLRQKGFEGNAALVHAFSTSMFELTLFSKKQAKVPKQFGEYKLKRDYFSCMVVNLKYTGHISQRVTQKGDYGFAMGGRVEVTFESYALNSEEIKMVEKEMEKEDVADSLNFSGDVASEALDTLKEDLDHFLNNDEEKEKKEEKKSEDINPFSALWGIFFEKSEKKKDKKEISEIREIKKDNYIEKATRAGAAKDAVDTLYLVYDIYKKSHGMASSPDDFDAGAVSSMEKAARGEKVKFANAWHSKFDKF